MATKQTVDEIAARQKELGDQITKILVNYKKDSEERKTPEYLNKRLNDLEESWKVFNINHITLQKYADDQAEHPYFKTDFFTSISNICKTARELMREKLKQLHAAKEAKPETSTKEQTPIEHQQDRSIQIPPSSSSYLLRKQDAAIGMIKDAIRKINYDYEDKMYFQRKMQDLTKSWNLIQENHIEIYTTATSRDECSQYISSKAYSDIEDMYEESMIKLQTALNKCSNLNSQDSQIQPQKITLPPLQLPQFSGDYQNWKSFQDLFIELIHNNNNLGNAQKMHYLKSNLGGEAKKLIQHLKVVDENYETAWNLLNSRYNNQRLLVSTQIHKFLTLPNCQVESAAMLKKLHDASQECLLTLKNLGIKTDEWDPFVTYVLTQKLDKDSHKHYEERLQNPREVPTTKEFFAFLEYRFQALEAVGEKGRKDNSSNKITKSGNHTVNLLHSSNTSKGKFNKMCPICKGNHAIFSCSEFLQMDSQTRKKIVLSHKLCLNCLQATHNHQNCGSKRTCKICNKHHNTLLHIEINPPETKITTHLSSSSIVNNKVMLATAMIIASSSNGSSIKLRALIDQGSQATIISEKAAQLLNLNRQKVMVNVDGVGENKVGTARSCVEIEIKPRFDSNFKLTTKALVLSKLTKMIPTEPIQIEDWSHIQALVLADPQYSQPGKIDIILGADVTSEILLPVLIKGSRGTPVAQQTELG